MPDLHAVVQATPASPHGTAELFAVSLRATSLDQSFPSQVDSRFEQALVEPMGVFQIPNTTYSALEGTTVSYDSRLGCSAGRQVGGGGTGGQWAVGGCMRCM